MSKTSTPAGVVYGLHCVCEACRNTCPGEIRYVGQTTLTMEERLASHVKEAKTRVDSTRPVLRWFLKHGTSNIRAFLLDVSDSLNISEDYWMQKLGTYGSARGLNAAPAPTSSLVWGRSHGAKFTDLDVLDIKHRIWSGESCTSIAILYDVPNSRIYQIKSGRSYVDVPWPIGPWAKSRGVEEFREKALGKTWGDSQRRKFQCFLDSWDENPFKREQPVEWVRKSKLSRTRMKIRDIRRVRNLARDGLTTRQIFEETPDYVTMPQVYRIVNGKRWAWVD